MSKIQKDKYYKYIIDCIDSDAYDVETTGTKEKLQFLSDTFQKEFGWNIERIGQYKAFQEWIQGLPSVFNIEFENYKILELAKKVGTLDKNATEEQEDRIIDNYWNFITVLTFQLFRKYKIN
jgi:hypothetical protein